MRILFGERDLVDDRPLTLGLVMVAAGAVGALLAPAYSLAAFALVLLGLAFYRWTPPEDRRVVLWILGLSLAFRLALLVTLHLSLKAQGFHGYLSGDEGLYFARALEYSEYLKGNRGSPFNYYHGVSGYVYFYGVVLGLTRPSLFLLKVLNLCVGLGASFGFYRWVRGEFGRRAGFLVLTLLLFYPSLVYWSITGLKEPHIIFILMVGLWSAYHLCGGERPWPFWAVTVVGAIAVLGAYNPRLSSVLGFAVTFGWLFGRYPRQVAIASASAFVGGILLYWDNGSVANMVDEFLRTSVIIHQRTLASSDFAGYFLYPFDSFSGTFSNHFGPNGVLWAGWLLSSLKGLAYFLFSPFPWTIRSLNQLLVYPQILLWYGLFPFVLYGAWVLLRADRRRVLPIVVFIISFTVLMALTSGNIGGAFRHRDWMSPFCLMFAGVGLLHFLREPELLARLRVSP